MQTLTEQEIISFIEKKETFEATLPDGSFTIKIQDYTPFICTAIHAGHHLRSSLQSICLLDAEDRKREEDPFTDVYINGFPITLIGKDSRHEYDLNRAPEVCVREEAWGKQVWSRPLKPEEIEISVKKHQTYYNVLRALLRKLNQLFNNIFVVDLHTYNWQIRSDNKNGPVFNIGTHFIDTEKWEPLLVHFENNLANIAIPRIPNTIGRDIAFQGKGYQAEFVRKYFPEDLLIPLEIKKVFMNEVSGEPYPLALDAIQKGLHYTIVSLATEFRKSFLKKKFIKTRLMPQEIETTVKEVDSALHKLAGGLDTFYYVNPINAQQEKRRFFTKKQYDPQFKYKQLKIDPYRFREKLYKLPVSKIQDPTFRSLYRAVVDNYATKIEMLTHVGSPLFLYNSLRYYGEPSVADIKNAEFILHIPNEPVDTSIPRLTAEQSKPIFEEALRTYQIEAKVVISSRLIANAMVDNSKTSLIINRNALLTQTQINSLIHHEIGVHLVTTMNGRNQPMKLLQLSFPGNTYTQEGLAILSEYLSGNLTLSRLKKLALRVLAAKALTNGASFSEAFDYLSNLYELDPDLAYSIIARVYRGGGFTKDFLYLKGFRDILKLYRTRSLNPLLIGKTSHYYINEFEELIERKHLNEPRLFPAPFVAPTKEKSEVLDFLVNALT